MHQLTTLTKSTCFLVGPSSGEDVPEVVKLLCTQETAPKWYEVLASALNMSELFGTKGLECSAKAATQASVSAREGASGSDILCHPSLPGTLSSPVCSEFVSGADAIQKGKRLLQHERCSFTFSQGDCDEDSTKNKVLLVQCQHSRGHTGCHTFPFVVVCLMLLLLSNCR